MMHLHPRRLPLFLTALLLLTPTPFMLAAEDRLEGTFWAEEPGSLLPGQIPKLDEAREAVDPDPPVVPAVERRLLEEARFVFSGMLYGWRFRYVPENTARGYEETFELEPVHRIQWGDAGLRVRQTWHEDGIRLARIEYRMDDRQAARRRSRRSGSTIAAQGSGTASLWEGYEQRFVAIEDAMRMSIREHLRARYPTPPREAAGSILLAEVPQIGMNAGQYQAMVRVNFTLSRLRQYEVF